MTILVYLDQSAWSAIDDDPGSEFSRRLCEWGRCGSVSFLVSWEIMMETAGLADGRRRRWEALRSFPGTVWAPELVAEKILELEGLALVAEATGRPAPKSWAFEARPLAETSLDTLEAQSSTFARLRNILHWMAAATRFSRRAERGRSTAALKRLEKRAAALMRGNTEEFLRLSDGPATVWHQIHAKIGGFVLPRFARLLSSYGYVAPYHRRVDSVFTTVVAPVLPIAIRRDSAVYRKIMAVWNDDQKRHRVAPALSCAAAVLERTAYTRPDVGEDDEYDGSEELDRRHAVYAPFVHVFTCDKRNAGRIRNALSRTQRPTVVAVAGRPDEVIDAISRAAKGIGPRCSA